LVNRRRTAALTRSAAQAKAASAAWGAGAGRLRIASRGVHADGSGRTPEAAIALVGERAHIDTPTGFCYVGPRMTTTNTTLPERRGVEWITCNLCGADDTVCIADVPVLPHHRGVYGRDTWPLVHCRRCGLHYHNPRFDAAARAAFYQFTIADEANYIRRWFVENADLQRPAWRRIARVLQPYCPNGKLLDVGCGPGWFLSVAREYGYKVVGQDISPPMVHLAAEQYQLAVEPTIASAVAHHGHFDVVTAFDVIEHHEDPLAMLREIHTALRPNGILLLTTHDIGNWFARFYGPRWRQINPIGHIT
jgi:hypothetical protein